MARISKNDRTYLFLFEMLNTNFIQYDHKKLQEAEKYVLEAIANGFPPDHSVKVNERKGHSLLHKALSIVPVPSYNYTLPDALMNAGADPNLRDCWGWNGLMTALIYGQDSNIVRRVLNKTKDLNWRSNNGESAFTAACTCFVTNSENQRDINNWENVRMLLDAGVKSNLMYEKVTACEGKVELLNKKIYSYYEQKTELAVNAKTSAYHYEL